MTSPNVLLIMTDEERYPPPYEDEAVLKFRREQLGARESLRDGGLEFHRHYAGSAEVPLDAARPVHPWPRVCVLCKAG